MKKMTWLGMAFAACALSACGGGSDNNNAEPPAPPPSAPEQSLPTVVGGKSLLLAGSLSGECGVVNSAGALTFHDGALWFADTSCQDGGARVQRIDKDSGQAQTYAAMPPDSAASAKAQGFKYPTGIAFDSHDQLYVMDGANAASKWPTDFSALPLPNPGHASGVWKVTSGGMGILAGVDLNSSIDGVGEAAGFRLANGLVVDADDQFYTQDVNQVRGIGTDGTVSTLPAAYSGIPAVDAGSGTLYVTRTAGGVMELVDVAADSSTALPVAADMVLFDAQGNLFVAQYVQPDASSPVVIYRRAAGGSAFEPVVSGVRYLNSAAIDDEGNLYLHQRNALVKVEFSD